MKFAPFQPLQTPRLVLRKFSMEDAPDFFEKLASSEKVTEFMLWEPHRALVDSQNSIRKVLQRYDSQEPYTWAIALKESGDLIGRIDLLRFDAQTDSCSFAYMLGADFWNLGYGTEAVKAVFCFAFSELEVSAIEADHMAENPASGAVMRKAGMKYLGVMPRKYEKKGVWHDAVSYRITQEEWSYHEN